MDKIKTVIENIINENVSKSTFDFKEPLIGYADASDLLFLELKKLHPHHLMPWELLENVKTIVAFYVPFGLEIIRSNRGGAEVSEKWARAYIDANFLINEICVLLSKELNALGVEAAYQNATHNFDEKTLTAAWSHRSIAYIAGMGTFGVNKMLITPVGCAGRFGSIAISRFIEPTPKQDKEYCLFYEKKGCLKCVKSCPTGALSEDGINKHLCYARLLEVAKEHSAIGFADVCGKCIDVCATMLHTP